MKELVTLVTNPTRFFDGAVFDTTLSLIRKTDGSA